MKKRNASIATATHGLILIVKFLPLYYGMCEALETSFSPQRVLFQGRKQLLVGLFGYSIAGLALGSTRCGPRLASHLIYVRFSAVSDQNRLEKL